MALVVNTLENSMVDNMADSLVVRPEGRTVKPLKGHCPNCNGDLGWRPHPEIPDRWERDQDYIGDCPHPEQPQGFLQLGRLVAAPYSTKDRLLPAFHQLGPNGSFRRDLIPASGLSEKQGPRGEASRPGISYGVTKGSCCRSRDRPTFIS